MASKGLIERKAQLAPQALELRIAGGSYRQIAKQLNCNEATAYRYVQQELAKLDAIKAKQAEKLRELELERCDRMTLALGRKVQAGEERAILALVRVMERRAKLTGIDVPVSHAVDFRGDAIFRWKTDKDE